MKKQKTLKEIYYELCDKYNETNQVDQALYDIIKLLELKIKLSERNETLGLTKEEFEEYQYFEKWFTNGL